MGKTLSPLVLRQWISLALLSLCTLCLGVKWEPFAFNDGNTVFSRDTYASGGFSAGTLAQDDVNFIGDCHAYDNFGSRVVLRLRMGEYEDFFRPEAGETLCTMLIATCSVGYKHLWSPAAYGHFVAPVYSCYGAALGGSINGWVPPYSSNNLTTFSLPLLTDPVTAPPRYTLSYWGDDSRPGGCCYSEPPSPPSLVLPLMWQQNQWGQSFRMDVAAERAGCRNPTLQYRRFPVVYSQGQRILPNAPVTSSGLWGYTVSPPLPAGLALDANTGAISGIPTIATVATPFVINARHQLGNTSFALVIAVTSTENLLTSETRRLFRFSWQGASVAGDPTAVADQFTTTSTTNFNVYGVSITSKTGASNNQLAALVVDLLQPYFIYQFAVTGYPDNSPTNNKPDSQWYLDGSSDGVNWECAGVAQRASWTSGPTQPPTQFNSATPARAYRFYRVVAWGVAGNLMRIADLGLWGSESGVIWCRNPVVYQTGQAIIPNAPTLLGLFGSAAAQPLTFTVSPPLPEGLAMNAVTGVITGVPTTASEAALPACTVTVATSLAGGYERQYDLFFAIAASTAASANLLFKPSQAFFQYIPHPYVSAYNVRPEYIADGTPWSGTGNAWPNYGFHTEQPSDTVIWMEVDLRVPYYITTFAVSGYPGGSHKPSGTWYLQAAMFPSTDDADWVTIGEATALQWRADATQATFPPIDAQKAFVPYQRAPKAYRLYRVWNKGWAGDDMIMMDLLLYGAETGFDYPRHTAIYTANVPIVANVPRLYGGLAAIAGSDSGATPLIFQVNDALPEGLALDADTGVISGTPKAGSSSLSHQYTINVFTAAGLYASAFVTIAVTLTLQIVTQETQPLIAFSSGTTYMGTPSNVGSQNSLNTAAGQSTYCWYITVTASYAEANIDLQSDYWVWGVAVSGDPGTTSKPYDTWRLQASTDGSTYDTIGVGVASQWKATVVTYPFEPSQTVPAFPAQRYRYLRVSGYDWTGSRAMLCNLGLWASEENYVQWHNPSIYTVGIAIQPNAPTLYGAFARASSLTFSASGMPSGLTMSTTTGTITGTPTLPTGVYTGADTVIPVTVTASPGGFAVVYPVVIAVVADQNLLAAPTQFVADFIAYPNTGYTGASGNAPNNVADGIGRSTSAEYQRYGYITTQDTTGVAWLQVDLRNPYYVSAFAVTGYYGAGTYRPLYEWYLQASNDRVAWSTLASASPAQFITGIQPTYPFATSWVLPVANGIAEPKGYRYYRIWAQWWQSSAMIVLDWGLFGGDLAFMYAHSAVALYVGEAIEPLTPTLYGQRTSGGMALVGYTFLVSPALPVGLTLDATTGSIGGKPLNASVAQTYNVSCWKANVRVAFTSVVVAVVSYNVQNGPRQLLTAQTMNLFQFSVVPDGAYTGNPKFLADESNRVAAAVSSFGVTIGQSTARDGAGVQVDMLDAYWVYQFAVSGDPTGGDRPLGNWFLQGSNNPDSLDRFHRDVWTTIGVARPEQYATSPVFGTYPFKNFQKVVATPTRPYRFFRFYAQDWSGSVMVAYDWGLWGSLFHSVTWRNPAVYQVGVPLTDNTPSLYGFFATAPSLSFAVVLGPNGNGLGFPAGLSMHPTTGVISGTPSAMTSANTTYVQVTVTAGANLGFNMTFGVILAISGSSNLICRQTQDMFAFTAYPHISNGKASNVGGEVAFTSGSAPVSFATYGFSTTTDLATNYTAWFTVDMLQPYYVSQLAVSGHPASSSKPSGTGWHWQASLDTVEWFDIGIGLNSQWLANIGPTYPFRQWQFVSTFSGLADRAYRYYRVFETSWSSTNGMYIANLGLLGSDSAPVNSVADLPAQFDFSFANLNAWRVLNGTAQVGRGNPLAMSPANPNYDPTATVFQGASPSTLPQPAFSFYPMGVLTTPMWAKRRAPGVSAGFDWPLLTVGTRGPSALLHTAFDYGCVGVRLALHQITNNMGANTRYSLALWRKVDAGAPYFNNTVLPLSYGAFAAGVYTSASPLRVAVDGLCLDSGDRLTLTITSDMAGSEGYVGVNMRLASIDLDCATNPCEHGVCQPSFVASQFQGAFCNCSAGWTGLTCSILLDCANSPCTNGGTCVPGSPSRCQCVAGWLGAGCEIPDDCERGPCQHNGQCVQGANTYTCACTPGYVGTRCETFLSSCFPVSPCLNGGTCIDLGGAYRCECPGTHTGTNCSEPIVCFAPPTPPANGSFVGGSANVCSNRPANYLCPTACRPFFAPVGEARCIGANQWSALTCVRTHCSPEPWLDAPQAGTLGSCSLVVPVGGSCAFSCAQGYALTGHNITCGSVLSYVPPLMTCVFIPVPANSSDPDSGVQVGVVAVSVIFSRATLLSDNATLLDLLCTLLPSIPRTRIVMLKVEQGPANAWFVGTIGFLGVVSGTGATTEQSLAFTLLDAIGVYVTSVRLNLSTNLSPLAPLRDGPYDLYTGAAAPPSTVDPNYPPVVVLYLCNFTDGRPATWSLSPCADFAPLVVSEPAALDAVPIIAGAAGAVLLAILCASLAYWNYRRKQRKAQVLSVRKIHAQSQPNSGNMELISVGGDTADGDGDDTNDSDTASAGGGGGSGDGLSAAAVSDAFWSTFPKRKTTKALNEYFTALHNCQDKALALSVLNKWLHPMNFMPANFPQHYQRLCEDDNLQRWIFPFLFKASDAHQAISHLTAGSSVGSMNSVIELGMVLLVDVHYQQFLNMGPVLTPALSSAGVTTHSQKEMVYVSSGLERSLVWLKGSREWVWTAEPITFARLILYSFTNKVANKWTARDDPELHTWANVFELAHVIDLFVFASPAESSSNKGVLYTGEGGGKGNQQTIGLHFDADGFSALSLVAELIKLLQRVETQFKSVVVDPPPKKAVDLFKRLEAEQDYWMGVLNFFTDANNYLVAWDQADAKVGEVDAKDAQDLETRLRTSSGRLANACTERAYHRKRLYKNTSKKDFADLLQTSIALIQDLKQQRRAGRKLGAIAGFANRLKNKDEPSPGSDNEDANININSGRRGDKYVKTPRAGAGSEQQHRGGSPRASPHPSPHTSVTTAASTATSQSASAAEEGTGAEDLSEGEVHKLRAYFVDANLIGSGAFGRVYKAEFRGEEVAVKVLHLEERSTGNPAHTAKLVELFANEIRIHMHVRSPRLVHCMRVYRRSPDLIMVMEFMPGGNLRQTLAKATQLTDVQRLDMAMQVVRGLMFLHENHPPIAHRDIKPENVLVDENLKCKLSDFGMSVLSDSSNLSSNNKMAGSALYMAPELFAVSMSSGGGGASFARRGEDDDGTRTVYGDSPRHAGGEEEKASPKFTTADLLKSDVYSLGVLLVEICGGKAPWSGKSFLQIIEAHRLKEKREVPKGLRPAGVEPVIKLCLVRDPDERPSIAEVLDALKQLKASVDNSYSAVVASLQHGHTTATTTKQTAPASPSPKAVTVVPPPPPPPPQSPSPSPSPKSKAAVSPAASSSSAASSPPSPKRGVRAPQGEGGSLAAYAHGGRAPQCDECDTAAATIRCDECDQNLCDDCSASMHKSGKRSQHTFQALEEMPVEKLEQDSFMGASAVTRALRQSVANKTKTCDECDEKIAVVRCDECQQFMCQRCADSLHKAGKRQAHQLAAI